MEFTTILGLGAGVLCIAVSILIGDNGDLLSFVDLSSVLITVGGTIASTIATYHGKVLSSMAAVVRNAFRRNTVNLQEDIELIVRLSNTARRDGLLALEDAVSEIDDPFLKKGVMLMVDGADQELIKSILEADIYFLQERHGQGQAVLDSMAAYAPAYGMIGTLIGLINMLKNLDNVSTLGPSMAVALVTTFYGVILANLVFTPLSKKLKALTAAECQEKELLLEGLLSVQDGENPRIIREKLNAFLSHKEIAAKEQQGAPRSLKPEIEEVANGRQV